MLRARLLGAFEVELDGVVIESPASQRPWAVFAYLALAPRPVSRAELAATFWPDVLDQSARASLRSALWTLRRQLGDGSWSTASASVFATTAGLGRRRASSTGSPPATPAALELCRGDLLEGVEDDWAVSARDRHRERVIELLEVLACAAEERGDFGRRSSSRAVRSSATGSTRTPTGG